MSSAWLAAAQLCLAAASPEPGVYRLPDAAFAQAAQADLAQLKIYADGMHRVLAQLESKPELFAPKKEEAFTLEQKRTLLSAWGAFFSYASAAEQLRQRYWGYFRAVPTGAKHAWGWAVTHAALTTVLGGGLAFADRAAGVKQLEVLLDEPDPEFGIPARAFAVLKEKVIHVATTTQLLAGDAYAPAMASRWKKLGVAEAPELKWAAGQMAQASKAARERLKKRGVKLFAGNAADILKDGAKAAVFPTQKDFAEWAGDTRVQRIGRGLVTKALAEELLTRLEPGDLVTTRQNWFLSNVGLPGFWKHAELYVGSAEALAKAFDADPQVKAWVAGQAPRAETFTGWLAARFPEKWKAYATGTDYQGHGPIRVIEAISEGVSFTSLEHAFLVDYLGVMRPRLPKVEKARAIARAFEYQGRPYDFDFDFFSDATLVCTELAIKAYAPVADMKGLTFGLVDVAGRMTLPANDMVKAFDAQLDRPDRQLDFVAFLDGNEGKGMAAFADAQAFRASWKRTNWDVLQP